MTAFFFWLRSLFTAIGRGRPQISELAPVTLMEATKGNECYFYWDEDCKAGPSPDLYRSRWVGCGDYLVIRNLRTGQVSAATDADDEKLVRVLA